MTSRYTKVFGSANASETTDSIQLWRQILDIARWAPSPHNVQHWKLRPVSSTEADLYIDCDRLLPMEDPKARFMNLGMGLLLECVSVVCRSKGYFLGAECLFPDVSAQAKPEGLKLYARLKLSPDPKPDPDFPDPQIIVSRRTSRLPFDGRQAADETLAAMQKQATAFGHEFNFTHDIRLVKWIVGLNKDTLFHDLQEDSVRRELSTWLRYSDTEAREKKDGLWARCMHFPGWFMKTVFRHPEVVSEAEYKEAIGRVYLRSMRGSKTVGWIKGRFSSPEECCIAGRAMARWWLTAARHGLYIHPFGSVITNASAYARLRGKLGEKESDKELWLLMRLGYSTEPPRSFRRDLDDLLITDQ